MLAVKFMKCVVCLVQVEVAQAAHINGVQVWRGPGPVKGVDPAMTAEVMARDFFIKLVESKGLLILGDTQIFWRNSIQERTFLGADGTIALFQGIQFGIHLKAYGATMAASVICRHGFFGGGQGVEKAVAFMNDDAVISPCGGCRQRLCGSWQSAMLAFRCAFY